MIMVYLLFILSIFIVRILAGYDSRYQTGKYFSIKNTTLSGILLDSMSVFARSKRLKKDKNKMSVCGIPFYTTSAVILIINLVFLIVPDIPIEPWGFETTKLLVYVNTLNDKISAIVIFLLYLSIIGYIAFSIIKTTKEINSKWVKVFVWIVSTFIILISVLGSIYFLSELIFCFL